MSNCDVSIIIVNWNVCDILRNCLQSIYSQTKDVTYELIVIDNASHDGSVNMIKKEFPDVVLIENGSNRGFAAANNQGLNIAKGRFVMLLNPDTIVLDGAIQKMIKFADMNPDIGVMGCQVRLNETEIQKTCFSFPSVYGLILQKLGLRKLFPRSRFTGWIDYGWWDRTTPMEVDVVTGVIMLVRLEAIKHVGLMDEAYFVYAEETDWCYRFKKAGWRLFFTPDACIIHLDGGSKSTGLVKVKMFVQMQKSVLIYFRKNKGLLAWFIVKSLYILEMSIRYIISRSFLLFRQNAVIANIVEQSSAALKYHLLGFWPE